MPAARVLAALAAGFFRMETERLKLSPWGEDDIDGLRALATDPEVVRYISDGVPWPEERIREFFDHQRRLYAERGYCMWRLSAGGEAMGFCGIQPLGETGEIEIGWWLAKAYWGGAWPPRRRVARWPMRSSG